MKSLPIKSMALASYRLQNMDEEQKAADLAEALETLNRQFVGREIGLITNTRYVSFAPAYFDDADAEIAPPPAEVMLKIPSPPVPTTDNATAQQVDWGLRRIGAIPEFVPEGHQPHGGKRRIPVYYAHQGPRAGQILKIG